MPLVLDSTSADTAVQSGTSGSLAIRVPYDSINRILIVAIASDYASGLGTGATSVKFGNYDLGGGLFSFSTGVAMYWLRDPGYTPGISTTNATVTFSASRIFAMCAYVISGNTTSFPFDSIFLLGDVTGDPKTSSGFALEAGEIVITCVKIEQNTILPVSGQTSIMNLSSGSGATLISYGSSYYQAPSSESPIIGWERQGTPVNDTWGLCGRNIFATGTVYPRVVTS